jgi:integrase/recombinase XerD
MAQGKQAKVLTEKQEASVIRYLETTRWSQRDTVIFLLSVKAGLRAKEISGIRWRMITDAEGNVGDTIALEDIASKGKSGRTVPIHSRLHDALMTLAKTQVVQGDQPVITSERGGPMTPKSIAKWFLKLYGTLGMEGCSSHSGRRTFITRAARKVSEVGGSVRDVQQLAGHSSLQTTQRYIEADSEAKRRLVYLI